MSSLLKEIFERLEFERLIEEGKDPVELLHYKFQNVPSDIIDAVIEIDPTKKKSYSQWLLSKWDDEKKTIVDNLKNGRIQKLFQHYKKHQDIQIKDCPSVEDGLTKFVPEEDSVLEKSSEPTTLLMNRGWEKEVPSELANDFDIVFNQDDWVIAVPNTYEADCKLGENMNWCTAGGRSSYEGGRSYFDRYLSDYGGKYFVNFDMSKGESRLGKDYPFTRYQFHFESNQFMDKEDDPVELSEIDMPESAKEYYSDEGYDPDNFEDMETRIERYEQQRWGVSYRLNDDLYLGIAYDEDFQFEEPNENTDFYIFSDDDDRDPISWDEVPNPHTNENVVISKSDKLIILRAKYGNSDNPVIAVIDEGGWSRYSAYSFDKHIVLPDGFGVFGISEDGKITYASVDGSETFRDAKSSSVDNIFVNEYCTKAYKGDAPSIFVEISEGEYHSLFCIDKSIQGDDSGCAMIVPRDIPINGKYFTINENGLVEGEFRKYRVYADEEYGEEDDSLQYTLESKFPNGDYLVSYRMYGEDKLNILKPGSKEPLLKAWFNKYVGDAGNLYCVKIADKTAFFNKETGEQIGRLYDRFEGLDKNDCILTGIIGRNRIPDDTDIISGLNSKVLATFKAIISRCAFNGKIAVLFDDGASKIYDYHEGKFLFPELGDFKRINEYEYPSMFACSINNTEEMAIFDLSEEKLLARGISDFGRFSRTASSFLKLAKINGKYNAFDLNKKAQILPNDVDEITGMNPYISIMVYGLNGKYYPLDYKTGQVQINPNGIGIPTYVMESGERIYCQGENYNIYFVPDGGKFRFYSWQNRRSYGDYGTNFDPEHTPQEVLNMYTLIFGEQPQQQTPAEQGAYAVAEEFKRIVKRIDEAIKRRYIDKID